MPSGVYTRASLITRFWRSVNKKGPVHPTLGQCWIWKNGDWYGYIFLDYKQYYVHRVSWELHKGKIPEGLFVLHRCDNPGCVNPDHLFLGTQKTNMRDCANKGRINPGKPDNRGERNGQAVLTADDVLKIRCMHRKGINTQEIATIFAVSTKHVRAIVRRKRWAWLS